MLNPIQFPVISIITLLLSLLLTGCLGGGGGEGGGTSSSNVTTETLTDTTVATITLIVTDNHQPADGKTPITLTVIVKNKGNMPLVGIPVSLISSSDFAFLAAVSGTTEESGRFTTTVTSSVPGTFEVTAIAAGVKGKPQEVTFVDSHVDPRVATVKLMVTNNGQRANGLDPVTVTVIVRDNTDVPVQNAKVQLISSSDSATFASLSGVTGEDGRFTTTVKSKVPETFTVKASVGGKQSETIEINFITSTDADLIQLEPLETVLLQQSHAQMTVTALDYVIRTAEGEVIYYQPFITSFNVAASGSAELHNLPSLPTLPSTDANGKATFTVSDSVKEDVTVTVSSGTISQTATLHFGASLSLLPDISNAVDTIKLKALLKGGNDNPLPGKTVFFRFIGENNKTLSPVETKTIHDGTAEVTVTDLASEGGNVTVEARSGEVTARATINFIANLAEDRKFEVKPSATILATGQTSTITAWIKDSVGIPVANQPVEFSVDGQATLSSSSGVTDDDGKVTTTVSNKATGNVTVAVRAGAKEQTVLLYFGATLRLTLPKVTAIADGKSTIEVVANLNDASGGGISGIPVDFRTAKSDSALLSTFREITDELGRASVFVTNTTPEETSVTAQVDGLTATTTFNFISTDVPDTITLKTSPDEPIELSLNGTAVIKAIVKDNQGKPVRDGIQIDFSTSQLGTITKSVFTRNGEATAIFNAGTKSGLTVVTATVSYSYFYFDEADSSVKYTGDVKASTSVTIKPGEAGIIEVHDIEPEIIGIKGSGVTQAATIQFAVKDHLGNPVQDGTAVTFSLGDTTLGGGESITTGSEITDRSTTSNGLVSVTLKSGVVAGNVDVIATAGEVSTVARVAIVGSVPDANHLSLAVKYFNIAGGVTFGLQNEIVAYVGDRFGNIVPDGISVSFITEGGTIGKSIGGGAFTTTTEFGQATAILQSAEPTTPSLGGVPLKLYTGYACCNSFDNSGIGTACGTVSSQIPRTLCSNPGLVTIVAYTTGSESFTDSNGNGYYDQGEPFEDVTEPFIDGNDNGQFDEGELYIDINNDRRFNDKDGIFQDNTTIWQSTKVLFSARTAPLEVELKTFEIPNGGFQTFTVSRIGDVYGNALVSGSKFEVKTNNGILGGTTEFTFPDSVGLGMTGIQFTLASNPPEKMTEKTGDTTTEELVYPLPTAATLTIKIVSPTKQESPGGNGEVEWVISGKINVP